MEPAALCGLVDVAGAAGVVHCSAGRLRLCVDVCCPDLAQVLDLDETLVHSTLDGCDSPDFSFPVSFNNREHRCAYPGAAVLNIDLITAVSTGCLKTSIQAHCLQGSN